MANSDYTQRGYGSITPSALLATPVGPGMLTIGIIDYSPSGSGPQVGAGIMVGGEIMRITSVDMPLIGVARGCADTVPVTHNYGETVWFFTTSAGGDATEYAATETIGVKVLMKSSGGQMGVENSPPRTLVFNQRFARPYPPGNVQVNGGPFYVAGLTLDADHPGLDITWAHRDRVTQGDQLIGHEVGSIGPEPGTSYVLRAYDDAGVLKRTSQFEGTTINYSIAQAMADLGASVAVGVRYGHLTLHSRREGFDSWQGVRIDFNVDSGELVTGWGSSWGTVFGQ